MFGFDFVNDLDPDEALITTLWTIKVVSGVDPDPDDHLEGISKVVAPTGSIINTATVQRIAGLLPGVTYLVRAIAVTDQGNTKTLWSHIRGVSDDT